VRTITSHLVDTDTAVTAAFLAAHNALPLPAFGSADNLSQAAEQTIIRRQLAAAVKMTTFRPSHFQGIVSFLLACCTGNLPADSTYFDKSSSALATLALVCQLPGSLRDAEQSSAFDNVQQSHDLSVFWALVECARYCIINKFKTPLGK
jgi:hypothetical protein